MVPAEVVAFRDPVILVVEDEVLIRISVCDFLRTAGFTVMEAGNGREALAILKVRADIALVLTDIHMSDGTDGVALIREIRKSYPAIKVITASAYRNTEPVEATVAKPYRLERLLAVIESVLGR
jgi:CheY-like chemotaxis protein